MRVEDSISLPGIDGFFLSFIARRCTEDRVGTLERFVRWRKSSNKMERGAGCLFEGPLMSPCVLFTV